MYQQQQRQKYNPRPIQSNPILKRTQIPIQNLSPQPPSSSVITNHKSQITSRQRATRCVVQKLSNLRGFCCCRRIAICIQCGACVSRRPISTYSTCRVGKATATATGPALTTACREIRFPHINRGVTRGLFSVYVCTSTDTEWIDVDLQDCQSYMIL